MVCKNEKVQGGTMSNHYNEDKWESIVQQVELEDSKLQLCDEIQEISNRHISSVNDLISCCSECGIRILLIVRAPNPLPNLENFNEVRRYS